MKHYVKNGFITPSIEGQMLYEIVKNYLHETFRAEYDDEKKTLTLYENEEVFHTEEEYDIKQDYEEVMCL